MSTETRHPEIAALVQGLDPIDWAQMQLTANLSPGKRILSAMHAQVFLMASLRGTLSRKFPELSQKELNMQVLAYLTTVRIKPPREVE
jgi:hypothetical protein